MTPEMTPATPPPYRNSRPPSSMFGRATLVLAAVGLLAVLGGFTVVLKSVGAIGWSILDLLTDSDEAPIRVRNGSADFVVGSNQTWEQVGSSGTWRIRNARRFREEFEVTLAVRAGAVCGGALTATGADVVVVYERDNDESTTNTVRIVLQSAGRRTLVRPDTGVTMTWNPSTPSLLRYVAAEGYVKSVAVGSGANPAVLCTFTSAAQLDHMLILNVP